jgi:acyl-CoA synthetase (AMP-forming)/AMP-acid ligase II
MPDDKHGSCGQLLPGVEVRIVNPDGDPNVALAPGEAGEICLRGPNVMRGICGRTREETFDRDGFYHSGDLGALDADGYLWFHGRGDDMFKVKGATVYPSEVEAALRAIAGVQQAHVTNVRNESGAEAVGALVVSDRSLDDLAAGARERLSAFKVPTRWFITDSADDVPMTATAKINKPALNELLLQKGTAR